MQLQVLKKRVAGEAAGREKSPQHKGERGSLGLEGQGPGLSPRPAIQPSALHLHVLVCETPVLEGSASTVPTLTIPTLGIWRMDVVGEHSRAQVWRLRRDQPGKFGWN